MSIAVLILGILCIIGIIFVLDYFFHYDRDEIILYIGVVTAFICGVLMIVFTALISVEQQTEKEYPASEYTLSYKITEFEGQRDTTYVIIPKEEKK